ncbi:universal stress protein [Streptomyces sioyaensis]|uniref:universal stress protein n=1 Tax=Streptomyces sioyaensis TaxID=67364 RepID=UPI0037B5868D
MATPVHSPFPIRPKAERPAVGPFGLCSPFRTDRAMAPEVAVTADVRAEDPVYALLDASDRAAAIIVGSRGHDLSGIVVGSVSLTVAARAHCPVVVVRGDAPGGLTTVTSNAIARRTQRRGGLPTSRGPRLRGARFHSAAPRLPVLLVTFSRTHTPALHEIRSGLVHGPTGPAFGRGPSGPWLGRFAPYASAPRRGTVGAWHWRAQRSEDREGTRWRSARGRESDHGGHAAGRGNHRAAPRGRLSAL